MKYRLTCIIDSYPLAKS